VWRETAFFILGQAENDDSIGQSDSSRAENYDSLERNVLFRAWASRHRRQSQAKRPLSLENDDSIEWSGRLQVKFTTV
jgi:hypothetical protein